MFRFLTQRHRHHHHGERLWLIVNDFAVQLIPNQEIHMAQKLQDNQIGNITIVAVDAAGNVVTPVFDSPPTWALTDATPPSGSTLTASADGTSAVLTAGTVGDTVTVTVTAVIGGQTFTGTLSVSFVGGAVASISLVLTPAPAPAPTPAPAPAPSP